MLCAALGGCEPAGSTHERSTLELSDARVRAPVPGTDTAVGYFSAHNGTGGEVIIVAVQSDAARAIEFHTTIERDGMTRMRRLSRITLGPGETLHFAPGGQHLMLFGATGVKDPVRITFTSADGRAWTRDFDLVPFDQVD